MTRLKKKKLEFIRAARRGAVGSVRRILAAAIACIVPLALLLAVGGNSIWKWNQASQMQREADEIDAYINRADIRQACEVITSLNREMNLMDSYLTNMENAKEIADSYPKLDEKAAILLTESERVSIEEVQLENDKLRFTAVAKDYREAAPYIEQLEASESFENVVYEGFELTDLYRFRISCRLRTAKEQQGWQENKGDS